VATDVPGFIVTNMRCLGGRVCRIVVASERQETKPSHINRATVCYWRHAWRNLWQTLNYSDSPICVLSTPLIFYFILSHFALFPTLYVVYHILRESAFWHFSSINEYEWMNDCFYKRKRAGYEIWRISGKCKAATVSQFWKQPRQKMSWLVRHPILARPRCQVHVIAPQTCILYTMSTKSKPIKQRSFMQILQQSDCL